MGPRAAACSSFSEKAGVRMCRQDHGASLVSDAVIGVGGNIVEQLVNSGCRGFGGSGLLGADGAERGEQLVIDGPGIVEKRTNDALNAFNVLRREYGFIGADWCHLLMGSICDGDVRMWSMLGFGRLGMCVFKEEGVYVAVHG